MSIANDKDKLIDIETKYNTLYNIFNTKYSNDSNDIITNCNKIYSQENKNTLCGLDFTIKLTPKQRKDMEKLKKSVPEQIYNEYKLIKEQEEEYKNCKKTIQDQNNYIKTNTDMIYNILDKKGFINNNDELTVKGIIASLVNDCNGILLAEIISNGMLNNLDTKQIIALVSIFTSVSVTDNDVIYISKNLNDEYQNIIKITDSYYELEKQNRLYIDEEYWSITNKYIDLTYDWVNTDDKTNFEVLRKNMLTYLGEINEYEGNFVRNMLKIYNILCNIKMLCNILKYYELSQKLEMVDTLILKDIVNVNSLYLK
jgi:antiviral helicase SKI2